MTPETEQFADLPEALIERLRARERSVSQLTPAVDRAVLEAAKEQFAPRHSRPAVVRRWYYPAAAAAAVALIALFVARPFDDERPDALRLADDVDGSGQVDILDAFALARARAADPADVNADRIDSLMRRIVSLGPSEAVL